MSEGPRFGTPSRFAPWQEMQLVSYSLRPAASAADSDVVSSAAWAGANTEYIAPLRIRAASRPATLASRRRCRDLRRARARAAGSPEAAPEAASSGAAAGGVGMDAGSLGGPAGRGDE